MTSKVLAPGSGQLGVLQSVRTTSFCHHKCENNIASAYDIISRFQGENVSMDKELWVMSCL